MATVLPSGYLYCQQTATHYLWCHHAGVDCADVDEIKRQLRKQNRQRHFQEERK